ncbi:hypothetical protein BKA93DRAFT_768546 [Sparassis latifolia]|uniref:Uncharacterized protein n=1 Tax=Sparassis crispa TaxID=139825 RepID=A0A401H1W9_9APHY|nr:hypothetical protein SCP_1302520 [Sparassis crispa]GBE88437.1 hypothetical protein SCP_1302520 [Sparassis crispa]
MRASFLPVAFLFLSALSVNAQTFTTTNPLGFTVVEVLTLDPLGLPTTEILSTVSSSSALTSSTPSSSSSSLSSSSSSSTPSSTTVATPTATATTTPGAVQQGPIEQSPTNEGPAGPTQYTYTTTNAAGETIAVPAVFTPTFSPTTLPNPTTSGSVLQYSAWLSMIGTHTVPANSAMTRWSLERTWYGVAAGTLVGVVGGALLVLA